MMLEPTVLTTKATGAPEPPSPQTRMLESGDNWAKFAVEPLERGFAITIGNALRRVLLSSMPGNAITWVKVDGVLHEYASLPYMKEEITEFLLNVKRVRIRSGNGRPTKMRLEVNGEGRVCAGDIATSADFEIVNPELHLATLDSNDASLAVEFNVEPGTGYEPALSADGLPGMPIGVLPVDAIYNPVRKVNYLTEKSRVGNATNYERLVLEVWTDGTITPADVVRRSSEILVTHFFLFSGLGRSTSAQEERSISVPPEIYQMPIEKLQLSPRTLNCLKRAHMSKVGQVLETPDDELLKIRNFGEKSLEELKAKIQELGLDGSGPLRADALVAPGEKGPEWRSAYGDLDDDDLPVGFTGERTAVADGIEDDDEEDYFDEDEDDEPAVRATPRPVAEEGLPDEAPNEDDYDKEGC